MELFISTLLLTIPLGLSEVIHVSCVSSRDCLLSCSFNYHGPEDLIHWIKYKDIPVHSFYWGKDQLANQNSSFSGRTSLFSDQIRHGNASLLLTGVMPCDEGQYRCYTSYEQGYSESFVELKMSAPIKTIHITAEADGVDCSTSGVYPAPKISWAISPTSGQDAPNSQSNSTVDERGLFTVSSTIKTHNQTKNSTYTCSISTGDGMPTWTASLHDHAELEAEQGENLHIPCPVPSSDDKNLSITWTFNKTNVPILSFDHQTRDVIILDEWEGKLIWENSSVQLRNVNSKEFTGTYTCEKTAAHSRHLVRTNVLVKDCPPDRSRLPVVGAICALTLVVILVCMQCKKKNQARGQHH